MDSTVFNKLKDSQKIDLVLSGHYHNGCIPTYFDRIFPTNRGLISPYLELFPNNARGIKQINQQTTGIIYSPITTFSTHSKVLSKVNTLYVPESQRVFIKSR